MKAIKSCATTFEAELLKGRLQNCGIDCILTNYNMNMLYSPLGGTFAPIGVLVKEEDFDKALEILKEEENAEA